MCLDKSDIIYFNTKLFCATFPTLLRTFGPDKQRRKYGQKETVKVLIDGRNSN